MSYIRDLNTIDNPTALQVMSIPWAQQVNDNWNALDGVVENPPPINGTNWKAETGTSGFVLFSQGERMMLTITLTSQTATPVVASGNLNSAELIGWQRPLMSVGAAAIFEETTSGNLHALMLGVTKDGWIFVRGNTISAAGTARGTISWIAGA